MELVTLALLAAVSVENLIILYFVLHPSYPTTVTLHPSPSPAITGNSGNSVAGATGVIYLDDNHESRIANRREAA